MANRLFKKIFLFFYFHAVPRFIKKNLFNNFIFHHIQRYPCLLLKLIKTRTILKILNNFYKLLTIP